MRSTYSTYLAVIFHILCNINCICSLYDTTAKMELILNTGDDIKITKYISGLYTNAGAAISVEGNVEQVHPNTLCNDRPMLTFGNIYVLKLESSKQMYEEKRFCHSAVEKANIAVRYGATAVILITTGHQRAMDELSRATQVLDRPVIVIKDEIEEDKMLTILNYQEMAYMRVTPKKLVKSGSQAVMHNDQLYKKETITYIGIAVIFGLIVVLSLVAMGVIIKLRHLKRQMQLQARGEMLESIGTHKYMRKLQTTLSSSGSLESSLESCSICLEYYKIGEDLRILPCGHKYHKKCIDKWLLEQRTCPCCCGNVDELLHEGYRKLQSSAKKYRPFRQAVSEVERNEASETRRNLLGESYRAASTSANNNNNTIDHIKGVSNVESKSFAHSSHSYHRSRHCRHYTQKEYLPSNPQQGLIHQQYQYLLQKLYELKRHQLPSVAGSDTESRNRMSVVSSSCYSSVLDIDSSIPCENVFIGDNCQGGVPQQCSEFSLNDFDLTYPIIKHCASSTLPTSRESMDISPYVSEWDTNSECCCHRLHRSMSDRCMTEYSTTGTFNSRTPKSRIVRFRDPESEIMSSAEEQNEKDSDNYECSDPFADDAQITDALDVDPMLQDAE